MTTDWPTPTFDRAGVMYTCSGCGDVVIPDDGDKECALQIAGKTDRVCESCARKLEEVINDG